MGKDIGGFGSQKRFIAQEVEEIYPESVVEDYNGVKKITYDWSWIRDIIKFYKVTKEILSD